MLATVAFLALVAVAFWRESLKLLLAGVLTLAVLGLIQVASVIDDIDAATGTPATADSAYVVTEPNSR